MGLQRSRIFQARCVDGYNTGAGGIRPDRVSCNLRKVDLSHLFIRLNS